MNNGYLERYRTVLSGMNSLTDEIPETMGAFSRLHQASVAAGSLSTKVKELIALAIGITVRCDGCIAYHVHDALEAGASRKEIMEAIDVAILMGGGPSVVYATTALEALNQFEAHRLSKVERSEELSRLDAAIGV